MRQFDGPNDADPRLFFDEGQEWHIGHPMRSAAHGLVAAGRVAVPGLLDLAERGAELGRRYAAFAMGEIAEDSTAIKTCLGRLTRDPNTHVRVSAIEALGLKSADETTITALRHVMAEDPDDESRASAALSLWRLAPRTTAAVQVLTAALNDGDRYVQGYALEALERIGTPDAIAALLARLKTARWCAITNPKSMF
jgi:HEAT repeat protein